MTRRASAAVGVLLLACGSPAGSASSPPPSAPPPKPTGAVAEIAPRSTRCRGGPDDPERVEVASGQTVITKSGVAVTFKGASYDHYDDGRFDLLLHLVFQGVMDDGELSPSALSWLPSALAKPTWVYLGVNRCVRVIDGAEERVVLELFEPDD